MATLVIQDRIFLRHLVPEGHPERPDRLLAIEKALKDEKFAKLVRRLAPKADPAVAALAHTEGHIAAIRAVVPTDGLAQIEADTWLGPESLDVALHAVGAACLAVDEVMTGTADNAFVAARPPGHHAEADLAMGFCLFNNAAITARHAQKKHGAERVAIVDWDVHHGNGTQAIFWKDPSVLYCSTHQMPLYPGTGAASETGVGNIVNAPLAGGAGSREFAEALSAAILPAIDEFEPDLIIISAGFDAHFRDPLGGLKLTEADFVTATESLMNLADKHCDGRIVSLLEGGYDLAGLADSTAAHVAALMKAGD